MKPFYRTCRPFQDGSYDEGGRLVYLRHPKFTKSPRHYINGYLLIQKDLISLFNYIEPSDTNLNAYSHEIMNLFLRSCIECEANFKAILRENGYDLPDRPNINHYAKVEKSHRLSSYKVKIPWWSGEGSERQPFKEWGTITDGNPGGLGWYRDYNIVKHDRYDNFKNASFNNLIDSICGVVVLLSSQFHCEDYSPHNPTIVCEGYGDNDGMETAIGDYFRIKFPNDWPSEERYGFDWNAISGEEDPFQKFNYNS